MLSVRDPTSSRDTSADSSSSDISEVLVLAGSAVLGMTAGFLVLLLARPECGGREAGRAARGTDESSGAGLVMVSIRSFSFLPGGEQAGKTQR